MSTATDYSVADELAFTALPEETQALIHKLVAGGYFPAAESITAADLEMARSDGYEDGYDAGYDHGKDERDDRYDEGYDDGYAAGMKDGCDESTASPS